MSDHPLPPSSSAHSSMEIEEPELQDQSFSSSSSSSSTSSSTSPSSSVSLSPPSLAIDDFNEINSMAENGHDEVDNRINENANLPLFPSSASLDPISIYSDRDNTMEMVIEQQKEKESEKDKEITSPPSPLPPLSPIPMSPIHSNTPNHHTMSTSSSSSSSSLSESSAQEISSSSPSASSPMEMTHDSPQKRPLSSSSSSSSSSPSSSSPSSPSSPSKKPRVSDFSAPLTLSDIPPSLLISYLETLSSVPYESLPSAFHPKHPPPLPLSSPIISSLTDLNEVIQSQLSFLHGPFASHVHQVEKEYLSMSEKCKQYESDISHLHSAVSVAYAKATEAKNEMKLEIKKEKEKLSMDFEKILNDKNLKMKNEMEKLEKKLKEREKNSLLEMKKRFEEEAEANASAMALSNALNHSRAAAAAVNQKKGQGQGQGIQQQYHHNGKIPTTISSSPSSSLHPSPLPDSFSNTPGNDDSSPSSSSSSPSSSPFSHPDILDLRHLDKYSDATLSHSFELIRNEQLLRRQCKICFAREACVMFLPCEHTLCCEPCVDESQKKGKGEECFLCRKKIDKILKIKFS